jgi:quercetin dioxygenase-like cupin family protein
MPNRFAQLQMFLDAAEASFTERAANDQSKVSVLRCFSALTRSGNTTLEQGSRLPVCDIHLAAATDPNRLRSPDLVRLTEAFLSIEPALVWRRRLGTVSGASDMFEEGHGNAMIVGPGGVERRNDVWLGVSIVAPHVRYPDHTHPPEETYLVMSYGEFTQGGGPWFEPGPGGSFYNPPGIVHAMRSGTDPLFAFWLLRSELRRDHERVPGGAA